jgi:hypothetical protein
MARRVNLPKRAAIEIFRIAATVGLQTGVGTDMVLVAKAIKYAGDNKHMLKPQWRS